MPVSCIYAQLQGMEISRDFKIDITSLLGVL